MLKLSVNDSKSAIKILFREVNKHVLIINLKKKCQQRIGTIITRLKLKYNL